MSLTNIRLVSVIDHFFISHPESGQKEGEEDKKLLYFYPRDAPQVGERLNYRKILQNVFSVLDVYRLQ